MTMTVREAHQWASSFLQKSGMPRQAAHLNAESGLRHVLGWDRARLFADRDDALPSAAWDRFRQLIARRGEGEPLQHLTGSQSFYGRTFSVSKTVLIPRPETEILVETVLEQADTLWGPGGTPGRDLSGTWGTSPAEMCTAVDVGTGSGAIAITLALERPHWQVTAIDLSSEALRVARDNSVALRTQARIRWLQGDFLNPLAEKKERVDLVVSNPPYIPSADIATLAVEVKKYEPCLALDGGEDGLHGYRQIIAMLPDVMKQERGLVAFEVGIGQSGPVADLIHTHLPQGNIRIVKDLAGIDRVVLAHWPT